MKKILLLVSILLLLSCSKEKLTLDEMKADKLLSESFTENELQNLYKIVDFFEDQILEITKVNSIEKRYSVFLKKDSIKLMNTRNSYPLDYNKQINLYSKLDTIFITNFFDSSYQWRPDSDEIKRKYMGLKSYGKYGKFLENYSNKNLTLKDYYIDTVFTNDFLNLSAAADLIIRYRFFNLKDIKIRLLYSMHYLSWNEYYYYQNKLKNYK